jgi:hypothetical protein
MSQLRKSSSAASQLRKVNEINYLRAAMSVSLASLIL